MSEPRICEVGGKGLFLPLGDDDEQGWPNGLRIVLYLLGLLWCFLGVAIISDVFMAAIEAVTSKKKRVKIKDPNGTDRWMTVQVWNDTVANLTLMALGSSAPEILLSVIELLGAEFYSGALGPSTIVGSAAFNLLIIIAVCISCIPDGEVRRIKDFQVFSVTASFSIWAYLWLIVILIFTTKDVVEPWEGVVTFLFFPVLVTLAYLADIGFFDKSRQNGNHKVGSSDWSKEELAVLAVKIRRQHGIELTDEQVSVLIEREMSKPMSRAAYRVAAVRNMTGGKRIEHHMSVTASASMHDLKEGNVVRVTGETSDDTEAVETQNEKPVTFAEFAAPHYAVLENCKEVVIPVIRKGDDSFPIVVKYKTRDGSAQAGKDYTEVEGVLEFPAGELHQDIRIPIIDDSAYEEDEDFYVDLHEITIKEDVNSPIKHPPLCKLGELAVATITIIDDDMPGVFSFESDEMTVTESLTDCVIKCPIVRRHGSSSRITCRYHTENGTAVTPNDYDHAEGEFVLEDGQVAGFIELNIKAKGRYEGTEYFRLILTDPTGGAQFDARTDGGEDSCILTIWIAITPPGGKDGVAAPTRKTVDNLARLMHLNWDKSRIGASNWKEQFIEAVKVNGGDEEDGPPSAVDYVTHVLALPWKLIFATVPPTDYMGGWICFYVALGMIGGVTAIIGDMAALLGCCMNVPDSVTAITFVALGTSLPDTFASKTAAMQDTYADASIGNVTGSNSVNVFLGLGLPWMLGSIYWHGNPTQEWKEKYPELSLVYPEGGFVVKSGDLGFSVIVYVCVALACVGIIIFRKTKGHELGGPKAEKYLHSGILVCLWLTYIGLSSWNSIRSAE
jgi:solute carrier family 8 (sodium/calcium exchanger)